MRDFLSAVNAKAGGWLPFCLFGVGVNSDWHVRVSYSSATLTMPPKRRRHQHGPLFGESQVILIDPRLSSFCILKPIEFVR